MRKRRRNPVKSISILVLMLVLMTGCKKTAVYHNLSEEDANEAIVTLYNFGIQAEKEEQKRQNEVYWNVVVDKKHLQRARKILIDHNIPRKKEAGLCGIYHDDQIVPTPDAQRAKFICGKMGDVKNALLNIPEVVDASVVINMPTPEEFGSKKEKRPTASVVLKVKADESGESPITESKMQQFVANSVEELNPRDVSVVISYVSPGKGGPRKGGLILPYAATKTKEKRSEMDTTTIAGIKVSKGSAGRLKIYMIVFFVILLMMSAFLVVNVIRTKRVEQEYKALSEGLDRPLLEGEVSKESPELNSGGEEEPK